LVKILSKCAAACNAKANGQYAGAGIAASFYKHVVLGCAVVGAGKFHWLAFLKHLIISVGQMMFYNRHIVWKYKAQFNPKRDV
ncbi:MAG TPA: hypothetical protein DD729_07620, partial [Rhodobacteraceae bacterium]|nr:hypothetical protein [Paracoccaceae bacterium]